MRTIRKSLNGLLIALLLWGSSIPNAASQTPPQPAVPLQQEVVNLLVGDIFEILPIHTLSQPTYSWILTQDRTFIQAGRAPTFRIRLIQPGSYTLIAEIAGGEGRVRRSFALEVEPRQPGNILTPSAQGSETAQVTQLITTSPAIDVNGRVVLPNTSEIVRLDPINPDIRPLALDTNIEQDSDGDGVASNDIDAPSTFFQSDATSLSLWFALPLNRQTIGITAVGPDGAAIAQRLEILSENFAREQGFYVSPVSVAVSKQSESVYAFSASFDRPLPETTPLLYHWEFGDGEESLLMNPTHSYAEPGTYVVKLRVKNIANGQEVATHEETLSVLAIASAVSSEAATTSSSASQDNAEDTPAEPSALMATLTAWIIPILIFIGCVILGILGIFLVKKLRGGKSISETLATMEASVTKQSAIEKGAAPTVPLSVQKTAVPTPSATATTTATPTTTTRTSPPVEILDREVSNASSSTAKPATPRIDEKNSPAWLKTSLAPSMGNPQPPKPATPTATGAPVKPSVPPPPTQKPAAQSAPTPPAPVKPASSTPSASLPSWLQQSTPVATTPPAPAAAVAPSTPATPSVPPVSVTKATEPTARPTPPTVPTPKPTPAAEPPRPAPVQTPPVPQPPTPVPTPKPAAAPEVTQPPAASPQTPPAPASPTPTPAPKPAAPFAPITTPKPAQPAPESLTAAVPSVPQPTPTPPEPPKAAPVVPPPAPAPAAATGTEEADEPIAIIRADSLNGVDQSNPPKPAS